MAFAEMKIKTNENLDKELIRLATDIAPKECRKFMQKEGIKLKNMLELDVQVKEKKGVI